MLGTPAVVWAIAAARSSYWRSSWVRSWCANRMNPTSTVAARIANWLAKISLESLRLESRLMLGDCARPAQLRQRAVAAVAL